MGKSEIGAEVTKMKEMRNKGRKPEDK